MSAPLARDIIEAIRGRRISYSPFPLGNVLLFGAKGDGKADDTAAIQAACNTGLPVYFPAINGPNTKYNYSDQITLTTPYQMLFGDGLQSRLFATSNFNLVKSGTFNFTAGGADSGPRFANLWFSCDQSVVASAGTRANLVPYPACLFLRNTPRFSITNCKIDQFLIGIDMQGNSGGVEITGLDIGCYFLDFVVNGSQDTNRLRGFHCIPFDSWTANQHAIYYDGGQICVASGRCDGLNITDGLFLGSTIGGGGTCLGVNSFLGTGSNFPGTFAGAGFATGFTVGLFENTGFDTNAQLLMAGAGNWFGLNNCYFSNLPSANFSAIVQNAGSLNVSNTTFLCGGPGATNAPVVINNTSASVSLSQFSNCRFGGPSPAGTGYTLISANSALESEIILTGNTFAVPNVNGNSVPLIQTIGAGPIVTMSANKFTPTNIGGTTQVGLSMDTDNGHNITGNDFNGWLIAAPTAGAYTSWTKSIIANNGKRGTLNNNNANIRALAGNSGSGAVAAASTVFLGPGGYANALVSVNTFHIPKAGIIVGFQVKTVLAPAGADTYTYTIVLNGVATSMTGQVSGAGTTLSVTTNFFSVAAGDRVELQLITSATATATNHSFSILMEPA